MCVLPPLVIVLLSVVNKKLYPETISILNYLDARFFLISCLVIPLLVIRFSERALLFSALSVSAMSLLFYDPILNLFAVGYNTLDGTDSNYFFSANFYGIISYVFILYCLLYEKRLSEKAFFKNEQLISSLHVANQELENQKNEITNQNSEIKLQAEELLAKQDLLVQANELIEQQKERLIRAQSGLELELTERNKELANTNDELIKYNHELQQFSYTISHNLRGPLARLLGLTNLMEKDLTNLSEPQLELVKLLVQSARELDDVIRDLGKIIDIRNDIFRIREKVFFQEEWSNVLRSLTTFVPQDMQIEADFRKTPIIYTVRPMLTSILYNMASNAIKYRSPERPLLLSIKTYSDKNTIVLEIKDNGLGMDLENFNRSIFGLYKRFHTHTEGKGLGLYLVKLQVESLGGSIDVTSQPDVGTTFRIYLNDHENIKEQIVFENECGYVFFNANTRCAGIVWKQQVTSDAYRILLNKCVSIVQIYRATCWLSDVRLQGVVDIKDQVWISTYVLPEASKNGLLRIAIITEKGQYDELYYKRLYESGQKFNIEVNFFNERTSADNWVDRFMQ
ncbi:MAG: hypothetical protein JST48_14615 [Bacteroidetes bacterium]|nr:hypothetical protein [Bacteroidota bacterium]